ncbi:MAG TPA: hypothetical protein PLE77_11210 [Kiritimatiellia bacterium]|nr:hypothetical protein [Kiritimatiellia bacterium]
MNARRTIACLRLVGAAILAALLVSGCATPALDASRHDFYQGNYDKAEKELADIPATDKDRVLYLMERGTVRQARGRYEDSSRDFIAASDGIDKLETYSLSRGASSMVINDAVQDFRGAPYERSLLHAFTAKDFLALGKWDDAAVEARRIIKTLDPMARGDYPEDAYSRYMAGFCLELIDDPSNAALQYRKAAGLMQSGWINENTGRFLAAPPAAGVAPREAAPAHELVCFILIGGSGSGSSYAHGGGAVYATVENEGQTLGRSYHLSDTAELAFSTEQVEAVRKAAKTVGRVLVKEAIAESFEQRNNPFLADLIRFVMIGLLERPDTRRWETLPRLLQVARVPCPAGLKAFDVTFRNAAGTPVQTQHVVKPISQRGNIYVSFCRDLPLAP